MLPVALEDVDQADGRRRAPRVRRLHRAEVLEDLGQPLVLPRGLQARDRGEDRGLAAGGVAGDLLGRALERLERGVEVAVDRARP